ncbi:MAG: 3-phosphoshikimate 1-carboxyvinyltransferase [Chitinophagaceae bacterium]|nr:3-phosphoshikimate 1-carboxyvinyltransferase [Chitinophagaceae bacterium]MCW5927453.1 3-phosphoshikimate 1-carboxyvinyltransferase [Chitinophagaceae bacterium]
MIVTIAPSALSGTISAPASKSSMQRACAAALLVKGNSTIINPGHSNDDLAALGVIRALGATVTELSDTEIRVSRDHKLVPDSVNCGESGLGIRMFAPLIALNSHPITINGEGSLLTRPMDFFDEVFPKLGITVLSNQGKLPVTLTGPLQPKDITIDGSLSSQFLTGLLMAYAAADATDVTIRVINLKSRPYIDLTLRVMEQFGLKVPVNNNYESFYFEKKPVAPSGNVRYTVEGDWSGGAFLLVAGAIAGNITVNGLDTGSPQADKKIMEALEHSQAGIRLDGGSIELIPKDLVPFQFDATDCPDLFPPLVALAACCRGTTIIKGVRRLAHKESDRGLTLQDEFDKMGVKIDLDDDIMLVHGGTGLKGAVVHSRHDHRIAMACAVAALKATGSTTIKEAQAVNKSYPDFYSHIQQLGAQVSIVTNKEVI